jgi:hypothetical protein
VLSAVGSCLQEFVEQASGALVGLYAELIGAVLPNISHPNPDIQQVHGRSSNPANHSLNIHFRLSSRQQPYLAKEAAPAAATAEFWVAAALWQVVRS